MAVFVLIAFSIFDLYLSHAEHGGASRTYRYNLIETEKVE